MGYFDDILGEEKKEIDVNETDDVIRKREIRKKWAKDIRKAYEEILEKDRREGQKNVT